MTDDSTGDKTVILPRPGGRSGIKKPMPPKASGQGLVDQGGLGQGSQPLLESSLRQGSNIQPLSTDQGTNGIVRGAATLIALLGRLRRTVNHQQVDQLHQDLATEISQFEMLAKRDNYSSEIVLTSRYVICSAIDEAIISTPWGMESGWSQKSLLSTFHRETSGGEKVFLILDRLLQAPAQNIDVLELIYLCLSLGFEGRYKLKARGRQELDGLMDNLYRTIYSVRPVAEPQLSLRWESEVRNRKTMTDYIPLWVVAAFMGALILLTYSGFRFLLHMDAKPVAETFQQMAAPGSQTSISNETQH